MFVVYFVCDLSCYVTFVLVVLWKIDCNPLCLDQNINKLNFSLNVLLLLGGGGGAWAHKNPPPLPQYATLLRALLKYA